MGCGGSKSANQGDNKIKPKKTNIKKDDKTQTENQNNKNQKGQGNKGRNKGEDSDDDSGDTVKGYEKPSPPKWKKRDVFKLEDMEEIDKNAEQVPINQDTSFKELASTLTRGLKTQLEKVRALFIWMGNQDIDGQNYPNDVDEKKPLGLMKLVSERRKSFTEFLACLCRAAKLQCVIVRGYVKSVAYEVGQQDVTHLYTSWNAVLVDGSWQIIHPYWAFVGVSGHDTGKWTKIEAEGKGTRQKGQASQGVNVRFIQEAYFLPHPDEFIYKCMAVNKDWQLVPNPWDLNKFCNVPNFEMAYFLSDYKLTSDHKAILTSENGMCEIEFEEKETTKSSLSYELFFNEDESEEKLPSDVDLPRTVFFETNGNQLRLVIRFHVVGIYKLTVKCSNSVHLTHIRLNAKEKSENKHMFPVNPPIGFGFGHTAKDSGLVAPSHNEGLIVTKRDKAETFKFRMKKKTELIAKLRHNEVDPEELEKYVEKKVQGKNVSIQVTIPEEAEDGEYALQIYKEGESDENNVLNYLLTSRKQDFESSKGQIRKRIQEERARRHLTMAYKGDNIGYLQRSINKFEKLNLTETDDELKNAKRKVAKLKKAQKKQNEIKRLRRNLKKAIKVRNLDDLELAITEAEESGYPELDPHVEKAREVASELERKEIDEHKDTFLRGQLKDATKAKNKEQLEEAIAEFKAAHLPDEGDLTKAKKVLIKLYEDEAEQALGDDNSEQMENILTEADRSVVARDLEDSEVLGRVERHLQQEKRLKKYLSPILDLKKSTVAEIQGYREPPVVTHDVMQATLITLGDQPSDVSKWKNIQKYLNPSGQILKRIKRFKMAQLRERSADRAERLLEKYTTNDVREVSAGVAAFYQWSNNMIEESKNESKDSKHGSKGSKHGSKDSKHGSKENVK